MRSSLKDFKEFEFTDRNSGVSLIPKEASVGIINMVATWACPSSVN